MSESKGERLDAYLVTAGYASGREKAKELLAYLVDRHGVAVTTEQIAVLLWDNRPYDRTLKNYVATVVKSLKKALSNAGVEDILIKTHNHLSVDVKKFRCS